MIIFTRTILISFLTFITFYAPYIAYLNHIPNNNVYVLDVKEGESINKVLSKFSDHNFMNKIYINIFIKANNISSIKIGEYSLKDKSVKNIILSMQNGNTITHQIRIIEGMNIFQLEELIDQSLLINDCPYLECLDPKYGFYEGTLFPDTYFYKKNMKSSEILIQSRNKLDKYLDNLFIDSNSKSNLTKNEILILASIIEKEAGNNDEKKLIASVFLKRLDLGMKLQADPTIIYGLLPNFDGDIKKSDILDSNNKFNTYMIEGLPPTPISISSASSIDAAVNSVPGDFLFFVADSSTSHYFSRTYDEHKKKVNELNKK